jgi:isocitrate/isopropylmalate dehydrogenase
MAHQPLEEVKVLLRALEVRTGHSFQIESVDSGEELWSAKAIDACLTAEAVWVGELMQLDAGVRRQLNWRLRRELSVPARVRPIRGGLVPSSVRGFGKGHRALDVLLVSDDGEVEDAEMQQPRLAEVARVAAELAQRRWGLLTLVRSPSGFPTVEGWEEQVREAAASVTSIRCETIPMDEVARRMAAAPGSVDVVLAEGRVADSLCESGAVLGWQGPVAYLGDQGRGLYPLGSTGIQGILSVTLGLRCSLRLDREAAEVERALAAAWAAASSVEEGALWEATRTHLLSDIGTSLAI